MNTSNPSPNGPTDISTDSDQWTACDGRQLQSLASRLRAQFMRKCGIQCCKKGAIMAVVALLVVTPYLLQPTPLQEGMIPCATCVERFVPYHSHLAGNLSDPSLSDAKLEEVRQHLEQCEMCRGKFEQAYPGVLGSIASLGGLAVLLIASLGVRNEWERGQ